MNNNYEMLDPTMLMMMGLMDHPDIISMETKRLKDKSDEEKIRAIIKRCMDNQMIREALLFDESLAELFINAEIMKGKNNEKA